MGHQDFWLARFMNDGSRNTRLRSQAGCTLKTQIVPLDLHGCLRQQSGIDDDGVAGKAQETVTSLVAQVSETERIPRRDSRGLDRAVNLEYPCAVGSDADLTERRANRLQNRS